jgi:hypothetical protein
MTLVHHEPTVNDPVAHDAEALIKEARQRQRKRRVLIGSIALIVAVAAGVWVATGGTSGTSPPQGASNGGSAINPPSSSKKPSHAKSGVAPSTTVPYVAASPIACGSDFFDAEDSAFLTKWFGINGPCLRASNSDVWIDVVSGGAVSGPGPGGSVVLVDRCASDATKCLDADATHSLADFTAYPSPAPYGNLQFYNFVIVPGTGVGAGCTSDCALPAQAGQLPVFSTGGCSVDVFDLVTGRWYLAWGDIPTELAVGNLSAVKAIPNGPSFPANQTPPPTPSPASAVCHRAV